MLCSVVLPGYEADGPFTIGKKPSKPNSKANNAAKATLRGVRTTLSSSTNTGY